MVLLTAVVFGGGLVGSSRVLPSCQKDLRRLSSLVNVVQFRRGARSFLQAHHRAVGCIGASERRVDTASAALVARICPDLGGIVRLLAAVEVEVVKLGGLFYLNALVVLGAFF